MELDSKTLDIVDRAKLTLLSERVGVMKMLKMEKKVVEDRKLGVVGGGVEKKEKDVVDKMTRYEGANAAMPELLDGIDTFIASGRNALLEEEEAR